VRLFHFLRYSLWAQTNNETRIHKDMQKPPKIPESVLVVIHTPELDVLIIERADHKGF